ncbi:tRNA (adenosine(37)-N6)-threonylcarbamoyltransferase complex ATPase subunit type 1 TsaE [Olleya marilimosa]|uniref:tRNA (adenosine(37)-N6)-threonylcarbamoyltransferase complex ATPase subunit type 1 TsaE n=1 Tax=Olleya marilimosa TaxID=272164 RepID=UPI00168D72BB|nr:tRNA (adenosine(37)-N6)-threonylcarbamoyltransferase complex ATPase subunit type 1 TsaE [Olleya marilimosa]MBD3889531.1 tRNA (adenosine(37)-N6)-threonylcarbamoyltransferase complex ATPase subunit type 1 TsaE [Olleya marilimosa]
MTIQYNIEQVETVAKQVLEAATSKIILFEGDMGVGKTTLIKTLVGLLGSEDLVSSPTFSLVNEYKGINDNIFHFDLYRIDDEEELYNFGIETYIYSNDYVFVEWPNLLKPLLQDQFTTINIKLSENSTRELTLTNND